MHAKQNFGWLCLLLVGGCSSENANNPPPTATPAVVPAPATTAWTPLSPDVRDLAQPQVPASPAPQPPAVPAVPGIPAVSPAPVMPPPATPETEQVKAQKGVGIAGRSLDPHEGVVVTPAKALFTVRERVVFEAQIPEALKLFKAVNGQGPKSHDEFMTQIIQANQIALPQLPPGQRYVYNPQTEELMVEKPRQ